MLAFGIAFSICFFISFFFLNNLLLFRYKTRLDLQRLIRHVLNGRKACGQELHWAYPPSMESGREHLSSYLIPMPPPSHIIFLIIGLFEVYYSCSDFHPRQLC